MHIHLLSGFCVHNYPQQWRFTPLTVSSGRCYPTGNLLLDCPHAHTHSPPAFTGASRRTAALISEDSTALQLNHTHTHSLPEPPFAQTHTRITRTHMFLFLVLMRGWHKLVKTVLISRVDGWTELKDGTHDNRVSSAVWWCALKGIFFTRRPHFLRGNLIGHIWLDTELRYPFFSDTFPEWKCPRFYLSVHSSVAKWHISCSHLVAIESCIICCPHSNAKITWLLWIDPIAGKSSQWKHLTMCHHKMIPVKVKSTLNYQNSDNPCDQKLIIKLSFFFVTKTGFGLF